MIFPIMGDPRGDVLSRNVKKRVVWNLLVPNSLDEAVKKALELGFGVSRADFIRASVRQQLRQLGIEERAQEEVGSND